ncbi:MAG: methylated-DNA--[protein]-cysteine S-methyltransferase [Eubacteriales bacterium]|nr:methylated-DNA--[protein]-cysteine S-methyltransferase [Eubacteriales bacterium]
MKEILFLHKSSVGSIELESEDGFITRLSFASDKEFNTFYESDKQKPFVLDLPSSLEILNSVQKENVFLDMPKIFKEAFLWLALYFLGENPEPLPPLKAQGTEFQKEVFKELLMIPYGKTKTYGELAKNIAKKRQGRMSAQAVGQAAGKNPIAIFIPCHRLIGAKGKLTGFSSGLDIKRKLLAIENSLPEEQKEQNL